MNIGAEVRNKPLGGFTLEGLRAFASRHWNSLTPLLGLAVMIIIFSLISEEFLTWENMVNVLLDSSVLLVLALASTTVILMGSIDLSVGSTLALCAYVGAIMAQQSGSNAPLVLVPLVGLCCGLINGLLVALLRLPSFLVTLGSYFVYDGMADYFAGGQPVTIMNGGASNWFAGDIAGFPAVTIWAVLALVLAVLGFRYLRFGRYIYAIGGNEKTARLSGVPVKRVKIYAFAVAGILAGLAGLLEITKVQSASPEMGQMFLLPAIAAVVMGGTPLSGGVGSPLRSLLGVLVIAILTNGMILTAVNPYLQNVIEGAVVVAAVAMTMDRRKSAIVK
jgi:ribose transport system permease protein